MPILAGSQHPRASTAPSRPVAEVPRWLWLWFAPLMMAAPIAVLAWDRAIYERYIESERGLVENATAVALIAAILGGVLALRHRRSLSSRLLTLWLAAVTIACVYFAGEEVSWGQHWLGWRTPEFLARINDQGETGLHNISSWLDQKPRGLLLVWVIVGGIFYPIWARFRPAAQAPRRAWQAWFWPGTVCLPAAVLAVVVRFPEYARLWFDTALPHLLVFRASEPQEYGFALFLLIYLWSLYLRLRARTRQTLQTGHR